MTQYQATLRESLRFEGLGLHSGASIRIDVRPAAANNGIRFVRGGTVIPALAEYVVETARATVLGRDGVTISTVEHLLAALFAMEVSNAEIAVDGPEIPVMDGSSRVFAEAVEQSGIVAQSEIRDQYTPLAPSFFRDGDRCIVILPSSSFRVRFLADFAAPIGTQYFDGEIGAQLFLKEIAGARTFGYLHEVEALRKRGLAQGGTLENAVVFGPEGPLQPLRFADEPVRHKVLDLIGDFALLGGWPQCEVLAIKSGHKLHCTTVAELRRQLNAKSMRSAGIQ